MKRHIFTLVVVFIVGINYLQAQVAAPPNKINYQAVIRQADGKNFKLSDNEFLVIIASYSYDKIIPPMVGNTYNGGDNASIKFQEAFYYKNTRIDNIAQFDTTTGLLNIVLGDGDTIIPTNPNLIIHPNMTFLNHNLAGAIDWAHNNVYLTIHVFKQGVVNNAWSFLTSTQLVTVPYSFYAGKARVADTANFAINAKTYTAGNGISIAGNVISLSSPDSVKIIAGNSNVTVTENSINNFTISVPSPSLNFRNDTLHVGDSSVYINIPTYPFYGGDGINIDTNTGEISSTVTVDTIGTNADNMTIVTGSNPNYHIYTAPQTLTQVPVTNVGDSIKISGVPGGVFIARNIPAGTPNQTLYYNSGFQLASSSILQNNNSSIGIDTLPSSLFKLYVKGNMHATAFAGNKLDISGPAFIKNLTAGAIHVNNLDLLNDSISIPLVIGNSKVLTSDGNGNAIWQSLPNYTDNVGLTSVGLKMPSSIFNVGNNVTNSGDSLTAILNKQNPNKFLAGAVFNSNGDSIPVFRKITANDIPSLDASKIGSGVLPANLGGTGLGTTVSTDGAKLLSGNGTGGYVFKSLTVTGLFTNITGSSGAIDIAFQTGGLTNNSILKWDITTKNFVNSQIVENSTNVGIGINSPQSTLHLHKSSATNFQLTNNTTTAAPNHGFIIEQNGATTSLFNKEANTTLYIGTTKNSDFSIKTNDTTRVSVLSNGNVGIGLLTPAEKLTVAGNFKADTIKIKDLFINGSKGNPGDVLTRTAASLVWKPQATLWSSSVSNSSLFPTVADTVNMKVVRTKKLILDSLFANGSYGNNGEVLKIVAGLPKWTVDTAFSGSNLVLNATSGDMSFQTGSLNRMRILANGNIGIGTTGAASEKLEVNANIKADTLKIKAVNISSGDSAALSVSNGASATAPMVTFDNHSSVSALMVTSNYSGSTGAPIARISNNGSASSTNTALQVDGITNLNGGMQVKINKQNFTSSFTNYTATLNDYIIVGDVSGGPGTIYLPTLTTQQKGTTYVIRRVDTASSGNILTIDGGTRSIYGQFSTGQTATMSASSSVLHITFDGANWIEW